VVIGAAALALVAAMAIDTKVVTMGSDEDVQAGVFSPETYGAETFPTIQAAVEARAVDARVLADAIVADRKAAEAQYGVAAGAGPVMAVKFSGVAGAVKSGMYDVAVEGMPEKLRIRVQTGPAVNGTDVRDATGTITFGQFTNQIEYQDAGSALNNEVKKQVLQKLDTTALTGKTLSVVGVFKLVNPNSWLVTPVRLEVQ
jgi:predicted lipoprotein